MLLVGFSLYVFGRLFSIFPGVRGGASGMFAALDIGLLNLRRTLGRIGNGSYSPLSGRITGHIKEAIGPLSSPDGH